MIEHHSCCETYLVKESVMLLEMKHAQENVIWNETSTLLDDCCLVWSQDC